VGLESGDPPILKQIKKGCTPDLIIKAAKKAKSAGLELCFYVLSGIGGDEGWKSHAVETASTINKTKADFIRLRTLTLVANSPLFSTWQNGHFSPISPLNRLKETESMIRELTVDNCRLESDHITNNLWSDTGIIYQGVSGTLQKEKSQMLDLLAETIEKIKNRRDIVDANYLFQQGLIGNL
jgi:radical SAM superfamily enzyme